MVERNCVYKFIARAQEAFEGGATLPEVLSQVDHYQRLVRRFYGPIKKPAHVIATSRVGLSTLATYEFARYKGVPLPDLNLVIQTLWPLKRNLRTLLGRTQPLIDRQELINF